MVIDQLITVLAAFTSIEMMVTLGLGVKASDVFEVGKRSDMLFRVLVANYIVVPLAALGLFILCHTSSMVAAGLLVAAACPGALYDVPFTAMAKRDVGIALGLIVVLAGSSALIAPLLLWLLLPLIVGGKMATIKVFTIVATFLGIQVLPLALGLWIRRRYTALAATLRNPASILSIGLNLVLLTVIIVVHFRTLASIEEGGYISMLCLMLATFAVGKLVVRHSRGDVARVTILGTSLRNVGVSLVITSTCFPGTAAMRSATTYGICQTVLIALLAFSWNRPGTVIHFAEQKGLP